MERVAKPFASRCVQVVVQSRLGHPQTTSCRRNATDPYGLSLLESPHVAEQIRRALAEGFAGKTLHVDISLTFTDGDEVALECWTFETTPTPGGKPLRDACNRLGMALKSLVTVTRTLPAYKMTRNVDAKSCNIHHKIYLTRRRNDAPLGNAYRTFKFNDIDCGTGVIGIAVSYRTKLVKNWATARDKQSRKGRSEVDLDKPMKTPAFLNEGVREFNDMKLSEHYRELGWLYSFVDRERTEMIEQKVQVEEEIPPEKPPSRTETEVDPFKKELNFAFVTPSPLGELAMFYRSFNDPPALEMFQGEIPPTTEDVSVQLDTYEQNQRDIEEIILRI